jgi:DNA-binding NarL/FixJ family response regulator
MIYSEEKKKLCIGRFAMEASNNQEKKIKVAILEDEGIARDGLALNLGSNTDISVIGKFGDPKLLVEFLEKEEPDVVTIDLKIGSTFELSFEVIEHIKNKYPNISILIITSFPEIPNFIKCLQLGVNGFIVKVADTSEFPTIPDVVRMLYSGKKYYDSSVVSKLGSYCSFPSNGNPEFKNVSFTKREREVMALLSQNMTDQQIAEKLGISENTIKTHNQNIFSKLNVSNRRDARNLIIFNELIPDINNEIN